MRHRLLPYPLVKFKGMMGNKKAQGRDIYMAEYISLSLYL